MDAPSLLELPPEIWQHVVCAYPAPAWLRVCRCTWTVLCRRIPIYAAMQEIVSLAARPSAMALGHVHRGSGNGPPDPDHATPEEEGGKDANQIRETLVGALVDLADRRDEVGDALFWHAAERLADASKLLPSPADRRSKPRAADRWPAMCLDLNHLTLSLAEAMGRCGRTRVLDDDHDRGFAAWFAGRGEVSAESARTRTRVRMAVVLGLVRSGRLEEVTGFVREHGDVAAVVAGCSCAAWTDRLRCVDIVVDWLCAPFSFGPNEHRGAEMFARLLSTLRDLGFRLGRTCTCDHGYHAGMRSRIGSAAVAAGSNDPAALRAIAAAIADPRYADLEPDDTEDAPFLPSPDRHAGARDFWSGCLSESIPDHPVCALTACRELAALPPTERRSWSRSNFFPPCHPVLQDAIERAASEALRSALLSVSRGDRETGGRLPRSVVEMMDEVAALCGTHGCGIAAPCCGLLQALDGATRRAARILPIFPDAASTRRIWTFGEGRIVPESGHRARLDPESQRRLSDAVLPLMEHAVARFRLTPEEVGRNVARTTDRRCARLWIERPALWDAPAAMIACARCGKPRRDIAETVVRRCREVHLPDGWWRAEVIARIQKRIDLSEMNGERYDGIMGCMLKRLAPELFTASVLLAARCCESGCKLCRKDEGRAAPGGRRVYAYGFDGQTARERTRTPSPRSPREAPDVIPVCSGSETVDADDETNRFHLPALEQEGMFMDPPEGHDASRESATERLAISADDWARIEEEAYAELENPTPDPPPPELTEDELAERIRQAYE